MKSLNYFFLSLIFLSLIACDISKKTSCDAYSGSGNGIGIQSRDKFKTQTSTQISNGPNLNLNNSMNIIN